MGVSKVSARYIQSEQHTKLTTIQAVSVQTEQADAKISGWDLREQRTPRSQT